MVKGVWSWSTSIYSNQVVTAAVAAAIEERGGTILLLLSCRRHHQLPLYSFHPLALSFCSLSLSFSLDVHTHAVNLTPIDSLKARHVHIG